MSMNPTEEMYPGSDFETDIAEPTMPETESDTETDQTNDDTFGEQLVPDETDLEGSEQSDQIGTETPLDQLRDEQIY
jgi:hypothetical protein